MKSECHVCFHRCSISEGGIGFCGARGCENGRVVPLNYGRVTSLALDPIEKKPLNRFFPGRVILSYGSYGCNLRCPFCQNHGISWSEEAMLLSERVETISPEELCRIAVNYRERGNLGVAFTYNEPLISWEFVRDTGKLLREEGLKTVLVTNGTASLSVWRELAPFMDALNIDLKGFTDRYYEKVLSGSRSMVMDFIAEAVKTAHVEITTLVIPGENDSEEENREMTEWIAGLKDSRGNTIGREIPLHISRFFPRFHMTDRPATDIETVYRLAEVAGEKLAYVYPGNC